CGPQPVGARFASSSVASLPPGFSWSPTLLACKCVAPESRIFIAVAPRFRWPCARLGPKERGSAFAPQPPDTSQSCDDTLPVSLRRSNHPPPHHQCRLQRLPVPLGERLPGPGASDPPAGGFPEQYWEKGQDTSR